MLAASIAQADHSIEPLHACHAVRCITNSDCDAKNDRDISEVSEAAIGHDDASQLMSML